MRIVELKINLITVPQGYYVACAISKDKDLSVGLPKTFNQTFNIANRLDDDIELGKVYRLGNAYSLIVKENSYDKADKDATRNAIENLAMDCMYEGVTRLAIPKLCCGKNGLLWKDVKQMIEDSFQNMDIEILVCE